MKAYDQARDVPSLVDRRRQKFGDRLNVTQLISMLSRYPTAERGAAALRNLADPIIQVLFESFDLGVR